MNLKKKPKIYFLSKEMLYGLMHTFLHTNYNEIIRCGIFLYITQQRYCDIVQWMYLLYILFIIKKIWISTFFFVA